MITHEAIPDTQLNLLSGAPRLQFYTVYFRSNLQYGRRELFVESAEHALQIAHSIVHENPESLKLKYYEASESHVDEIEVCDEEYNRQAFWQDEERRLHLATRELLNAAKQVLANWDRGDLVDAVRTLSEAVAKATGGVL
jgi:hypothetical protein